ncbi:hypothetical protein WKW44_08610 [Staphylococcus saprophyticus]|uniref:hypothetical protein n=1 Tax=Staphylococcus saprophyticus TaxID=29385 RepID=UPI0029747C63|nr:hypothetical protein [Staphylococcus saprophyticus]
MKIKTKKTMNLPQLIEWAWDNPDLSNGMTFISNSCERVQIDFRYTPRGVLNLDVLNGSNISNDIQFTLEELVEITEDTELYGLVELGDDGAGEDFFFSRGLSINDCKDEFTQAFYILNDDLTMTLIWRDGKLVE